MPEMTEKQQERIAAAAAVIEQTENASPNEIGKQLSEVCTKFLAELDALSESQAAFSPGEAEWSVSEVCRHMSHAVRNTALGIVALAQGMAPKKKKPVRMGVLDPDPGSFKTVREGLEEAFDQCASAIPALASGPDLEAAILHPYFGELNCRKLAAFNLLHINVHVQQLQRIKQSPEFPSPH